MIDVGILDSGDMALRWIGEELIREKHKGVNFFFIGNTELVEGDYIIAFKRDKNLISRGEPIILTEDKDDEGVFIYQAKGKIKSDILKFFSKENIGEELKVITGLSPFNQSEGTIFNHFLASEIAAAGYKVCYLSINVTFPYRYLNWADENKGLLKAIYYHDNDEPLNPGILSNNIESKYQYVNLDINISELNCISKELLLKIKTMIESLNFKYLIIDYGNLSFNPGIFIHKYHFYLRIIRNELDKVRNDIFINQCNCSNYLDSFEIESMDYLYSLKNNRLRLNYEKEEIILWKRSLRNNLLKN